MNKTESTRVQKIAVTIHRRIKKWAYTWSLKKQVRVYWV